VGDALPVTVMKKLLGVYSPPTFEAGANAAGTKTEAVCVPPRSVTPLPKVRLRGRASIGSTLSIPRKTVSLRVRKFETGSRTRHLIKNEAGQVVTPKSRTSGAPSRVNDRDGNPIDISAVVVWRVHDTAEALFEVDDYEDYLSVQSESALRVLASRHPYDSEDGATSLRGSIEEISDALRNDIQERLDKAGIQIVEARISHLAYSPEIAAAMLQRQQAKAVIAARALIVDGAGPDFARKDRGVGRRTPRGHGIEFVGGPVRRRPGSPGD
jgi:hypothetical protein